MSGEDFFSRWSRRKREVREAERAEPPAPEPAQEAKEAQETVEASAEAGAEQTAPPEPELSPEDLQELPSLEELTPETDLSVFFRKGVPQALRNAAMRRMWSLDPAVRDYVGDARDYAWNWNVPGDVPGYGPLASTDEVYATLDRMFSPQPAADAGREPDAERPAAPGHNVAAQHGEAPDPGTEPPETAAGAALSAAPQHGAPALSTTFVDAGPRRKAELTASDDGVDADVAAPQQTESEALRPRPRRHGGAAPV